MNAWQARPQRDSLASPRRHVERMHLGRPRAASYKDRCGAMDAWRARPQRGCTASPPRHIERMHRGRPL